LHCPKKDDNHDGDAKSSASTASSVKKLTKEMKSINKKFSSINAQLQQIQENESDLLDSEEEEEASHFQIGNNGFLFTQMEQDFEPRITKLFKQVHSSKSVNLDLKEVILLDSQSTMDLICNRALVTNTYKSTHTMQLCSNGGTMVVSQKASIPGYHNCSKGLFKL
jgi:predicted  nucleic acid-binding Zn-ribbon protein